MANPPIRPPGGMPMYGMQPPMMQMGGMQPPGMMGQQPMMYGRPPIGMQQPPIMGYQQPPMGYQQRPPMGMGMGMGMGMAPPMRPPSMPSTPSAPKPPPSSSSSTTTPAAPASNPTTIFVGNISSQVANPLVRQVLTKCGTVLNWNRIKGSDGKLKGFGFCTYNDPDSTLRALRLLNGLQVGEKQLLLKPDEKTTGELRAHIASKYPESDAAKEGETATESGVVSQNGLPTEVLAEDASILESVYELIPQVEVPEQPAAEAETATTNGTSTTDEATSFLNRTLGAKDGSEDNKPDTRSAAEIHEEIEKFRGKDKPNEVSSPDRHHRGRRHGRDSPDFEAGLPKAATMEEYLNKAVEIDRRKRAHLLADRLKKWKHRESQLAHEKKRDEEREASRKERNERDMAARRKMEAEYDDDVEDSRLFNSNAMKRHIRERQREMNWERKDREEEIRELEQQRQELEEQRKQAVSISLGLNHGNNSPAHIAAPTATSSPNINAPHVNVPVRRPSKAVIDIFKGEDDEDDAESAARKKPKLIPIKYTDEQLRAAGIDPEADKKAKLKALIQSIPTGKDELFVYDIDWTHVDPALVNDRLRPWINTQIKEYLGGEESSLVEFICSKVLKHTSPKSILEDVSMVLDEEAEIFIVKLWRRLVYESLARKQGLS